MQTATPEQSLRDKLARANENALRARLEGRLHEAAAYQREAILRKRWYEATHKAA